jgi:hypothetical protein
MHLIRAIYVWSLHSPRAKRSCWRGVPPALPQPTARAAGRGGGRRQRASGPLPSRPLLPASQGHATVLSFSLLSTVRPTPAGGEACVGTPGTRCWGPRRVGARFCFRGSRAMPLWPAAGVCGASGVMWPLSFSLSCHPCSFAVSLAVMSANLATYSCRPCAGSGFAWAWGAPHRRIPPRRWRPRRRPSPSLPRPCGAPSM